MSAFRKAVRRARKLRMSIQGPAGSGKTRTALEIATRLGGRVAVIDTEHSSADVYAPKEGAAADPSKGTFDFDALALESFAPQLYMEALFAAAKEGYGVVIIDSLSHAWIGEGGILQQADAKGGKFDAWKSLTPQQNKLMETVLTYPGHVIVTMRTKTAYEVTKERDRDGREKTKVEKVGTAPVQKDGTEYEFDIVIDIDTDHTGHVTKTRCSEIEGQSIPRPGAPLAATIKRWLDAGAEAGPEAPPRGPASAPPAPPAAKPDPKRVEAEGKLAKALARFPEHEREFRAAFDSFPPDEAIVRMGRIWTRLNAAAGTPVPKPQARSSAEQTHVTRLRDVLAALDAEPLPEAAAQARAIIEQYGGLEQCPGHELASLRSQIDGLAEAAFAGKVAA